MDIRYFIGVDISKATLDWAVFDGKTIVLQSQSANSEVGIKTTLKLIKALADFKVAESVCCMEHTGIYNAHLLSYLRKISLPIWLENSLQIKSPVVYNGAKMMLSTLNRCAGATLPSMPSGSAIRCGFGNHPDLFYKNWRPSVRFANGCC